MVKSLLKEKKLIIFCLFIVLSLSIYSNSLFNGFVWDDHFLIEDNPYIKNFNHILDFFTKDFWKNTPVDFSSGFYRPLVLISFTIDYKIWDLNPFGFHLINLAIHLLNSLLLFCLIKSISNDYFLSLLGSIFFCVHPIQTEVVNAVSNRGDLLATFFILLTILFYLKFSLKGRISFYILSIISLFFALLSKEIAMIALFLLLLVDLYFISDFNYKKIFAKRYIFLGYLFTLFLYILVRVAVLGINNTFAITSSDRYISIFPVINLYSHLLLVSKIIFLYFRLLVFPINLCVDYIVLPSPRAFELANIFALTFLLSSIALIILLRKRQREISFSLLWFFITILPLSNLFPISNTITERFLYFPSIGFCLLAATIFTFAFKKGFRKLVFKILIFVILISLIFFYMHNTVLRNYDWNSDLSLWNKAVVTFPDSVRAHYNLGVAYLSLGLRKKAEYEFNLSEKLKERYKIEYESIRDRLLSKTK